MSIIIHIKQKVLKVVQAVTFVGALQYVMNVYHNSLFITNFNNKNELFGVYNLKNNTKKVIRV